MTFTKTFTALLALSLVSVAATSFLPGKGRTVPLLLAPDGAAPNDASTAASLSPGGRYVAVTTRATNVVGEDTDTFSDIVISCLKSKKSKVSMASKSTTGDKANGDCREPMIDLLGRHIVFSSDATNLVADDTNAMQDVFVRNLVTGVTSCVSVGSGGTQADGRSSSPTLDTVGHHVAFESAATNLVADDLNLRSDIFVRDVEAGVTQRVSLAFDGGEADDHSYQGQISGNGRWVAFVSRATNLLAEPTDGRWNIFVRDLHLGVTELVSVGLQGALADGDSFDVTISANGRRVAFSSLAGNLATADVHAGADVFVRDRKKLTTKLITAGTAGEAANAASRQATISANGKWVGFTSDASNLVAGDTNGCTDVFRHGLKKKGGTVRASISSEGVEANGNSDQPSLTRNGRFLAFSTRSNNLFDVEPSNAASWSVALRRP